MAATTNKPAFKTSTDRLENEGGRAHLAEVRSRDDLQPDLEKLGVTAVHLTVYECAGYRYSNLRDAVAAAKRAIKTGAS